MVAIAVCDAAIIMLARDVAGAMQGGVADCTVTAVTATGIAGGDGTATVVQAGITATVAGPATATVIGDGTGIVVARALGSFSISEPGGPGTPVIWM